MRECETASLDKRASTVKEQVPERTACGGTLAQVRNLDVRQHQDYRSLAGERLAIFIRPMSSAGRSLASPDPPASDAAMVPSQPAGPPRLVRPSSFVPYGEKRRPMDYQPQVRPLETGVTGTPGFWTSLPTQCMYCNKYTSSSEAGKPPRTPSHHPTYLLDSTTRQRPRHGHVSVASKREPLANPALSCLTCPPSCSLPPKGSSDRLSRRSLDVQNILLSYPSLASTTDAAIMRMQRPATSRQRF